jgi:hypothetical protein
MLHGTIQKNNTKTNTIDNLNFIPGLSAKKIICIRKNSGRKVTIGFTKRLTAVITAKRKVRKIVGRFSQNIIRIAKTKRQKIRRGSANISDGSGKYLMNINEENIPL